MLVFVCATYYTWEILKTALFWSQKILDFFVCQVLKKLLGILYRSLADFATALCECVLSASEMTCIVSSGALNSTHSLTVYNTCLDVCMRDCILA